LSKAKACDGRERSDVRPTVLLPPGDGQEQQAPDSEPEGAERDRIGRADHKPRDGDRQAAERTRRDGRKHADDFDHVAASRFDIARTVALPYALQK
jgi:hypothetical protein